jgi:hypothetical protein
MILPTIAHPAQKLIGVCKMMIYDVIQQGGTAEEAMDMARGMVWSEVEATEQDIKYSDFVDTADGIDVYYDYGADYYFFADSE